MALFKIDINGSVRIYQPSRPGAPGGWSTYSKDPSMIARSLAGGLSTLDLLDAEGGIWGFGWITSTETGWSLIERNSSTRAIAGSNGVRLYKLYGDGSIWAIGAGAPLDNNPATRAIVVGPSPTGGTDGPLYKLHGDGSLWTYTGTPLPGPPPPETSRVIEGLSDWLLLDDNPATIAVARDYSALYQLRGDGSIWQYTGTPISGWQPLYPSPSNVRSIAAGADPTRPSLYFLGGDGLVAQYTGTPGVAGWLELGKNPATIAIAVDYYSGPPSQLYRLDGDGRILYYLELSPRPLTLDEPSFSPRLDVNWVEIDSNPGTISICVAPELLLA